MINLMPLKCMLIYFNNFNLDYAPFEFPSFCVNYGTDLNELSS